MATIAVIVRGPYTKRFNTAGTPAVHRVIKDVPSWRSERGPAGGTVIAVRRRSTAWAWKYAGNAFFWSALKADMGRNLKFSFVTMKVW